ncbi:MAG: cardiolipin synthase [Muribaculum sp.]|nr:cardiolipin synthase [Muribaculum sp.]
MSGEVRESEGLSLLKKGQKGIVHAIFSRMGIMFVLLVLQVMFLFSVFRWFEEFLPHILGGTVLFTVIMVLYLLNSRMDPTAKITWLVVIMLLPVFGALFYWYTRSDLGHKAMKKRMTQLISETKDLVPQSQETLEKLKARDPGAASLARYINRSSGPVYENTTVTYFPLGEDKFAEMLRQLEQAKEFIFLEYFIIDEGMMWGKILEILARKAGEGVDVRVMYDGMCEFVLLPHDYPKRLKKLGIKCKAFAPLSPMVSTHYNYRDHRKILVIDGHTAFNGGVNLADEYINHVVKYGHWKDTAIMLQGEAVKSLTLMFLQMWSVTEVECEFSRFLNSPVRPSEGFVIPYGDCPLDDDKVGERVYMDILNRAKRYVYIMTPYLILDSEMETALKFAAERGVDVRLILPGIPDKTAPYALAKTHYAELLDSGIQIYEYTPGFVHAKVFLADDREAVVGTINLDYRSLYHHFECATYMNSVPCIPDIKADFQKTLPSCRQVTKETIWQGKGGLRILGAVLKAVAPLL